jgi:peroxiredoxin Q/BCP
MIVLAPLARRMLVVAFAAFSIGTRRAEAQAPELGAMAPDFTLASVAREGMKVEAPVRLSDYRGRVVVLAFYPGDKTTGCTAELTKFRDEYTTIFGSGADVVVLPISVDGIDSHARWSSEMRFPFPLLSDTSQVVAAAYGSTIPGRTFDNRTVFVVDRTGRVAYRNLRFGALNESAYEDLAQAIAKSKH